MTVKESLFGTGGLMLQVGQWSAFFGAGGEFSCTSCYIILCMHTHVNKHNAIPAIPYFYILLLSFILYVIPGSSNVFTNVLPLWRPLHPKASTSESNSWCHCLQGELDSSYRSSESTGSWYVLSHSCQWIDSCQLLGVGNLWTVSVNIFCLITMVMFPFQMAFPSKTFKKDLQLRKRQTA